MTAAAFNRELGLKINREVWNGRQLDKIAEYFAEDFVTDYSHRPVGTGAGHRPAGRLRRDRHHDGRDSKVVHQTGVIDNVTGLRQVGVLPAART